VIAAERVTGAARNLMQRTRIPYTAALPVGIAAIVLVLLPFVFHLDGHAHAQWLRFFGHFHPALLHIPIGLIILLPVLEIAGAQRPALREAAGFVLRLALALALPTFALGYMLAYGSGDTGSTLTRHLWGAIALCIALMLCSLIRPAWAAGTQPRFYPVLVAFTVIALFWTGHNGGSITYGGGYLTSNMPAGLRRIFPAGSTGIGADPASFYAQHIHPVLDAKCVACHGTSTEKGGLRLDTYPSLMHGGKDGLVVIAAKPEASLLLARVTLPTNDKHYMPAEGRTPLTPDEIKMIRTWITAGASSTATTIPGFASVAQPSEPPPQPVGDYSALMPEIERMQQQQGAKLVPVSGKPSDGLILRTVDIASTFNDAQLAQFEKFAPYIVEAELSRTAVTDASFDTLRTFTHLRALRLDGTAITGSGLAKLATLTQLTYLNLSNTRLTAQSAGALKSMPQLRHVYLFNSPAQPDATAAKSTP
jgi:mono/diheme cytochrome c family protein